MKKLPLLLSFFLLGKLLFAQSSEVIRNYISTYKDIAIQEMQRTGVPAAITLAQGIHETGAGQSVLVKKSNNHFGIKCKSEWTGESVSHDDDARGECFRKYDDPLDSYKDHSDFLKTRSHYAFLFKLDPTDYEAWAYGLKKAGYATNPKYPQILIKLIRDYDLQDYTLVAMERKPVNNDVVLVSNGNEIQNGSTSDTKASGPEVGVIPAVNYPSGVFKINETKVIWITKGTSYLKIAEENNVSLARLFEFNDMCGLDIALIDQLIFLQRKRKKGANEFHIVAQGETTHDIAQKEAIRMETLLGYNFLKEGMQPKVGEKLYLWEKAPGRPKLADEINAVAMVSFPPAQVPPAAEQVETKLIFHTVQLKETMYAIAKKYDVAVEDIMKWNAMPTTDLKTGQQLRINKKIGNATN
jgi:LysM repeat protein